MKLATLAHHLAPATPLAPLADDFGATMADWMAAQLNNTFIEGMKALATLCWFLEKIAAGIARFLINEDMWALLQEATLGSLRDQMPTILRQLLFAGPDGTGGLVYIALALAGICLILPQLGSTRPVETGRVISWAIVIAALFLASRVGYDLVGFAEALRVGTVRTVIASVGDPNGTSGPGLDDLVARPMMALTPRQQASPPGGPPANHMDDYSFVLPDGRYDNQPRFRETYFPEPAATDYERRVVAFGVGPFRWEMGVLVESEASQQRRRELAQTGMALAGLTLFPGAVLLMFGGVFASLGASALILMVFFLVALPLGFFEFGSTVITAIARQYMFLWMVSLLAAILPAVLLAAGALAYPPGAPPQLGQLMAFIPVLLIVALGVSYVSTMARSALTDTAGIVATSIRTSFAPLNAAGSMPRGAGDLQTGLAGAAGLVAGGVGLAAGGMAGLTSLAQFATAATATGGLEGGALATGGHLLHQVNSDWGAAAATLAKAATGNSERARLFSVAASGKGATGVAAEGLRQRRVAGAAQRAPTAATPDTSQGAQATTSEQPGAHWGQRDAAAYVTSDPRHLDRAEEAWNAGQRTLARGHLERLFGDRGAAHQALALYERDGETGQAQVRRIVETTQGAAGRVAAQGQAVFTPEGQATPAFQQASQQALQQAGVLSATDPGNAALVGALAGATVRQPVGVWALPHAAAELARATLYPGAPSPVSLGADVSAQFALRDLAQREGWGANELEALFSATQAGVGAGSLTPAQQIEHIATQMHQHGELRPTRFETRREAARLALLVAADAQAERGTVLEIPGELPVKARPHDPHAAGEVLTYIPKPPEALLTYQGSSIPTPTSASVVARDTSAPPFGGTGAASSARSVHTPPLAASHMPQPEAKESN